MTIQDKARIIARDTRMEIPIHVRQSCQRIIISKAFHEPVQPIDLNKVRAVYNTHYARQGEI